MKATRGKKHDYLRMNFDFSEAGKVHIDMCDYIENMLNEFPMELAESDMATTPATDNLFRKGHGKKLQKERAEDYHTSVARGLFVCKWARPDIQPTIVVLCTRVKEPNESDWNKLI